MPNSTDAQVSTDVPISTDVHLARWSDKREGEVLVRFDQGFPCLVRNHPRAAALIALLGQPHTFQDFAGRVRLAWNVGDRRPIEATLALSRDYTAGRKIVGVSATPEAFLAATRLALAESQRHAECVNAAKAALVAACEAFNAALAAEERAHERHGAALVATVTQSASPAAENCHSPAAASNVERA